MESTRKCLPVQQMGAKIHAFFLDPRIEQLARQTKFVQRRSPLTGLLFLQTLVLGYLEQPAGSLSHLAQVCEDLAVPISAQGIDERINRASVDFLEAVLAHALQWFQQQCPLVLAIVQQFGALLIVDSTFLCLPAAMQADYPGAGGKGSPASLKIQLVFDFLAGQFQRIDLQAGRQADQAYRDYLQGVQAGALVLADLGYFCLDAFAAIVRAQAFFLSRYHDPTALLTPMGERIDLLAWLRMETQDRIDRPVRLGSRPRHRLPCRLIAVRAPAEAVEQRRARAIEAARQHHKVLSADYLELLAWSLYVTNVPLARLSLDQVVLLYRVRWQIELLFKLWKSYAGLKAIGPWRSARILTELYAKLIGCVLFQFLLMPVRIPDDEWAEREVSLFQAHHILQRFVQRLTLALNDQAATIRVVQQLLDRFIRFALKQRRVKDPNLCQALALSLA